MQKNLYSSNKIYPCLWFDGKASEAAKFYIDAFGNGAIQQDAGMTVIFEICGSKFLGLNGGPMYSMNPSISLFVVFDTAEEIEKAWKKISRDGKVLMPFQTYPWATKYGWVQDTYGLSWQLSFSDNHRFSQKITPLLLFTKDKAGQAKNAIEFYTSVFSESKINLIVPYAEGEGDKTEFIKHAQFVLHGQNFMAMDSSAPHDFTFSEGVSFVVDCDGQEEVDFYWEKFTAQGGQESMCSWCKDKFGVSWQIVPRQLVEALQNPDKEKAAYAMERMLQMKKILIKDLQK